MRDLFEGSMVGVRRSVDRRLRQLQRSLVETGVLEGPFGGIRRSCIDLGANRRERGPARAQLDRLGRPCQLGFFRSTESNQPSQALG